MWVGPAYGDDPAKAYHKSAGRTREIAELLKSVTAPCYYVDSTKFWPEGRYKTKDGVHFTDGGYRQWARDIDVTVEYIVSHAK